MTSAPLDTASALSPDHSAVVEACAGSGKTWLLVSRMIRLLLAGAKPSELLAITFTRKAAQEMTDRLHEWLQMLALGSDEDVRQFLRERSVEAGEIDSLLPTARRLLETVLTAQPGPTITTFHGWFLDLLKRAPLEAGLPWGAPLLEREKQLQREVWEELAAKWAAAPDTPHGIALTSLLHEIGQHNLETLLFNFLQRRAEWWAFASGQTDPVAYALDQLRHCLQYDPNIDPVAAFWTDESMVSRTRRIGLALEKGSATERKKGLSIQQAADAHDLDALRKKMLKQDGGRLASKGTKGLLAALKAEADAYLRDYEAAESALEALLEHQAEIRTWQLNCHGLLLGNALLESYQLAKSRQGVIDFTDAEWMGCRLLQDEVLAPALALKLDTRYRHLLLDEFQDTNPLQWRAISTWLKESLAADAAMTVFMVGDPKQAIYRFRRGEARVFGAAAAFLQQQFNAARLANNMTRRLGPELVSAINQVFADMDGFQPHAALPEHAERHSAVRCLKIKAEPAEPLTMNGLRNPLTTPLDEASDKAVHLEAAEFARVLKDDVLGRWAIQDKQGGHPARPGDVMALIRKRTHLKVYESELEKQGIPFITSRRGGLLRALEAQDVIALLETLGMPHGDLKLAHTLRSPLFSCSDDELLGVFAPNSTRGWDKLLEMAATVNCPANLQRAARLLNRWRNHIGSLPVHDLLDRIYFEGDVESRYAAAAPKAMQPQVAANLRAFMQLALTQDAGRYPSLAGFIRELKELVDDADAAPGEGIAADGENAVRLLTIHGAKGLEAPIVWLLGGSDHTRAESFAVLAPWLPQDDRPSHFSLCGRMEDRCAFRAHWFAEEATLSERESINLLYVGLTRAEQALIVSGDAKKNTWLSRIAAVWEGAGYHTDLPPALPAPAPSAPPDLPRIHAAAIGARILPAKTSQAGALGELFHACLEHHAPPGTPRDLASLALRLGLDADILSHTESTAKALLAQAELARFFDPSHYVQARNEMIFINQAGDARRIDRVVEFADEIWVLDYKTGEDDARQDPAELIARHRSQLDEYSRAINSIWPNKAVRAGLVLGNGKLVTP